MSRFVAPNLSKLGNLPLVQVDFETTETARRAFYVAALKAHGIDYDVENLETDPVRIAFSEGGAYQEMALDQRINEAIRNLSLAATQDDGALDHIGATYYGVSRGTDFDGDGNPVPSDRERFRNLISLAPEAFSTAGPEGAYVFHTLELDGEPDVADVATYSEEDGATYSNSVLFADAFTEGRRAAAFENRAEGDPVLAPDVLVVALPSVAYGPMDSALLARIWKALQSKGADGIRPLGDNVRVEAPTILPYVVEMELTYARGADPTPLVEEARKRVKAYTDARRRVGVVSQRVGIGGAAHVTGVEHVNLIHPATDVGGGSKQAPECTAIVVRVIQSEGTWQG